MMDELKRLLGIAAPDPVPPPQEIRDASHRMASERMNLQGQVHFIENSPDVFKAFVKGMREGIDYDRDDTIARP